MKKISTRSIKATISADLSFDGKKIKAQLLKQAKSSEAFVKSMGKELDRLRGQDESTKIDIDNLFGDSRSPTTQFWIGINDIPANFRGIASTIDAVEADLNNILRRNRE